MARVRPSTTPNPNAMKFTLDVTLPARIDTTRGEGEDTPFARAVLAVEGVAAVFGVNDFVTVTREAEADWDAIVCAVEEAAAEHLDDEPGDGTVDDALERARTLLRNAVSAPKPTSVEIRGDRPGKLSHGSGSAGPGGKGRDDRSPDDGTPDVGSEAG